jgi:hypothetical protein
MVRFVTALVGLLAVSTDAALRGNNASGEEAVSDCDSDVVDRYSLVVH